MAKRALGPATLRVVQAVAALDVARLAVGCSGGADSLALVAAATLGLGPGNVRALIVDHGLQNGSEVVAAEAVAVCAGLGVDSQVLPVSVTRTSGGLEADAREARYSALLAELGPDEWLAVGHTLDDQAESVLLGLVRGSGARSLSGMALRSGRVLRPFLELRRSDTEAACRELGLTWWRDPHNRDPVFTRVRVREEVLPVLEATLGPGVISGLARTASLARDDADALDCWVDEVLAGRSLVAEVCPVPCVELSGLPAAIRSRIVRRWLVALGVDQPSFGHVQAVLVLVLAWRGQGPIQVPGAEISRVNGSLMRV